MDAKQLASAVRNLQQAFDGRCEEPLDGLQADVKDLLGVLAHIVEGMPISKAFGSPGDWGYCTPIGKALSAKDPS